nr:unnamed protein product [Callosobruchus analis]
MTTSRPYTSSSLPMTKTHLQLEAGQNFTPTTPWVTLSGGIAVTQKTPLTETSFLERKFSHLGFPGATPQATRLTEVKSSGTFLNLTQKTTNEVFYNGTGYYIEAEDEPGLNDLQTVSLACVITLICLVLILLFAFGIRIVWKRYRKCKYNSQYDGIIRHEGTSESLSRPLHSHLTDKVHQLTETAALKLPRCSIISIPQIYINIGVVFSLVISASID